MDKTNKTSQHETLKIQVSCILEDYSMEDEHIEQAAQDIADVILTSWDLTLSDLSYADSWLKKSE